MISIDTARLHLQPLTIYMAQAAIKDRVGLSTQLGARIPSEWPAADIRNFLPVYGQIIGEAPARDGWGIWLIALPAESTVVGDIGFKGLPDTTGTVEVGYSVLPAFQRRGLATEAALALIAWALVQPRVHRVVAECLANNAASIRVLEKAGMQCTGQREDLLLWEIVVPANVLQ